MTIDDLRNYRIEGLGNIYRYLCIAKAAAEKSDHDIKLGCCIVQKKQVVSIGFNRRWKTHPMIKNHLSKCLHAETDGCIGVDRRLLDKATVFVYRERKKDGHMGCSKPCDMCIERMTLAGIRRVFYTDPAMLSTGIGCINL